VWSDAPSHSLVLHSTAQDVPKQWVSPTAERVWHRMNRLKETEFRLWAEEERAKKNSPLRIWGGLYPVVGLGVTAMISKEFGIMMLGEYQYIPIFVTAVSGVYVYGRAGIEDFFKAGHTKKRTQETDVFLWKIELAQEALAEHRANAQQIDVVQEYKSEHIAIRKELATYYAVKPRHEFRTSTIQKLDNIIRQDEEKRGAALRQVQAGSQQFVIDRITGDAGLRQTILNEAIEQALKTVVIDAKDPVVKVYNEYLTKHGRATLQFDSNKKR